MGIGTLATDYVGAGNKAERSTGLIGAVDSSELTISLWFLIPVGISGTQFFYSKIRSGPGVDSISFDTSNNSVNILMHNDQIPTESNPLKDIVLDMSSEGSITLGVWHHLLASWKKAPGFAGQPSFNMFIDDVDRLAELGPGNKLLGTIEHTTAPHTIAGSNSSSFEYSGCMSEFYFNSTEFIDFSITSNRRLFIDGSGNPVELGSDGSLPSPTLTPPIIYLPDGDATTNAGSGGDFVQQGSVAVCATIPGLTPSLTPRDIIEQVKNEIDVAGIAETDDFLRLRLGFSESFLCDALSKFDEGDLRKVAKGVRKAVKFLELAVEKGFDAVTILDWGDRLCGAIRTIASDEIDAAIARTGDPVKIAEAQDVFADGELEKLFDEFLAAINDFEKAIKSATVA